MIQTIQETIEQLHGALRDYIEATYHISAPALIEQRKELLNRAGIIFQVPYIESTPRYQSGDPENITFAIPGTTLQEMALKYKESLFNWNIRRFLGRTV